MVGLILEVVPGSLDRIMHEKGVIGARVTDFL